VRGPVRLGSRLRFPRPGRSGTGRQARSRREIKVSGSRSLSANHCSNSGTVRTSDEKPVVGDFEALAVVAVRRGGELDDLNGPAVWCAVPVAHTGMMSQVRKPYAPYGQVGNAAIRRMRKPNAPGGSSRTRRIRPATAPLLEAPPVRMPGRARGAQPRPQGPHWQCGGRSGGRGSRPGRAGRG
jgi:hypothetical protein